MIRFQRGCCIEGCWMVCVKTTPFVSANHTKRGELNLFALTNHCELIKTC